MITSEKSKPNQTNVKNILFLVAFFALIVDQATKLAALHFLRSQPTLPVIPRVFHLTLVENPGVAFGIFYRHADILFIVISICVLCLILFARSYRKADLVQQVAYGLILGGAAGNWLDRLRIGHVVDFLDFRIWPVFNMADFCISTGVGLFFLIAIINFKKTS